MSNLQRSGAANTASDSKHKNSRGTGIIRVAKVKGFSTVSNQPFNDRRLSYNARGLLAYFLTKSDGWQVRVTDLVQRKSKHNVDVKPVGVTAIRGMLKELERYGYLKRTRKRNNRGQIEWETVVYECPYAENLRMEPCAEKPPMENRQITNNGCNETQSCQIQPVVSIHEPVESKFSALIRREIENPRKRQQILSWADAVGHDKADAIRCSQGFNECLKQAKLLNEYAIDLALSANSRRTKCKEQQ